MSFSDFECAGKRKQNRRQLFLAEMEHVVEWSGLVALIEPHYPKAGGSRKPVSTGNHAAHSPAAELVLVKGSSHHPFRVIKRQFSYVKPVSVAWPITRRTDHSVCPVESVEGAPATIAGCGRGAPVRADNQGFALVIQQSAAENRDFRHP